MDTIEFTDAILDLITDNHVNPIIASNTLRIIADSAREAVMEAEMSEQIEIIDEYLKIFNDEKKMFEKL